MSSEYIEELCDSSNGHPYVLKIMLGEVKITGQAGKPDKLISKHDDVLIRFSSERLSLVAQRVFLTLCSWRSLRNCYPSSVTAAR